MVQVPPWHESPEQQLALLAQELPLFAQLAPLELDAELVLEEVLLPPAPVLVLVGMEPAAHPKVGAKRRMQGRMDSNLIGAPFRRNDRIQQRPARRSSRHRT
jgi:hypothetical protein